MHKLLKAAIECEASDLHITNGAPPIVRIDGGLKPLNFPTITAEDSIKMIYSLLNDSQKAKFENNLELDLSLEIKDVGRFRVNVHKQRGAIEAAFRVVTNKIRTIKQLGLPSIVEELARKEQGLVLITGPTGSGKTTTLAAIINQINSERHCVIVTIEDPIEYIHTHKKSIIKQREVMADTKSFADALKHVLRQDPDVICIGEMRDLETISTALTAAETGQFVLATIHTPDAAQTVDRIVDVFPPYQQQQIRVQFANTLEGIIAQQLLPVSSGNGRVVACEILIANIAVRKIIRSQKTEQIETILQTSSELGMMSMDKSLKDLYDKGLITYDEAISNAKFPQSFNQL